MFDTEEFTDINIRNLTSQEEVYVQRRVQGLNPQAAARAAGYTRPTMAVIELAEREDIQHAIVFLRETARQAAINAGAMQFSKDDATLLYLNAHAKAATATEEIKAVDSLVKLHGLAAPEKMEVEITRRDQLEGMSDEDLMRVMGDKAIVLDPSEYRRLSED